MARPALEIHPLRGKRLKEIIKEQNISQKALGEATGISQQAISEMVREKVNVTETTAKAVLNLYPQYRYEWLMGLDDFKTTGEQFYSAIDKANQEGELLFKGLCSFAALSGFSISLYSPKNADSDSLINLLEMVNNGYVISRNGKKAQLSLDDFNELENEICDYVEMRLDRIIRRQNSSTGGKNNG